MSKKCWFDLDGTLYNLYNIPDWLDYLENEKEGIFTKGELMVNEEDFTGETMRCMANGWEFGVISWLPMGASPEYEEQCRKEKMEWIKKYLPFVKEINIVPYGVPTQNCIQKKAKTMVLIDDNIEVCKAWDTSKMRKSINVNEHFDVMAALESLD